MAVFVAAGLVIAYSLLPVLKLVAVAMLVALVFRSITNGLKRLKIPTWATPVVLLGILGVFGVFVWLVVVPNLQKEIGILISNFSEYVNSLTSLEQRIPFAPDVSQISGRLKDAFRELVGSAPSLGMQLAEIAAAIIAGTFIAIYSSVNPKPLVEGALRLVPRDGRTRVRKFLETLEARLQGWIVGTAAVSSVIGVGGGIGLWLLGVPLPITFGLIAGVLNVVPYLGSTIGALLPALVALTISPIKALLVLVLFLFLNQLEGNILQPVIMGREVKLHPTMVVISFLCFGTLLGVAGALLAVPAAVVIATLLDEFSPQEELEEDVETNPKDEKKPAD